MSHELRTPLNAIIGFTGTLLMQLPGPLNTAQEKQLGIIQRSAKHLLALINDILDLARIESGKIDISPGLVSCQAVIQEVAAELRTLAEQKGLRLLVSIPAEPVVALADQRALSQILLNLVNNAIKFTDMGEVRVRVRREARGSRPVRGEGEGEQVVPDASYVLFEISDTGIGIKPEDHARLFQLFGRVDSEAVRKREGTGLGLRISQELAEQMGGQITLESTPGAGSTFTLRLLGVEASGR
jgi:protein-histidine pros-kinase